MTAPTPVDQSVRDTIGTALDDTLFVEAGAGTGKTTQLVDRVVRLVVDGGVELSSIAAITFTEAAAAELRDRTRGRLEQLAADDDAPESHRSRSTQALAEIDMAAISTLHAFAYRILSEHPVDAGLPPRVDVLDEVRSQLAFEARWDGYVDDLMTDPAFESLVIRATRLGVRVESRYSNQGSLKDVARVLAQNWDRLDSLLEAEPTGPLPAVDRTGIREAVDVLLDLDPTCSDPAECELQQHLDAVRLYLEVLLFGPDDAVLSLIADSSTKWTTGRGNKKHCDDPAAARDALKAIKLAVETERNRLVHDVLCRFGAELTRFTLAHAEQRAADGELEFHDLLVLARRLVRSSVVARAALHERYQRLLLDEFQDTDPIQIELAGLIAAGVADDGTGRATDTDEGRLFFVGDAKQSIYRFRRADIRVFMAARSEFGGGEPLALTENFRTVSPVIEWINEFFGEVMLEEPGRQPGYVALSAFRGDDSGADHRPILMGGPHPDLKAAEIRTLEAEDVARVLADIVARPECWPVHDEATGSWRPARLDDVAVLLPARTSLRFLEEALRAVDVSYRVDTGALVYDTQEVIELLAVLRVVDDPTDALALVSALRSPLFGCGDDDLATYALGGGRWVIDAPVADEWLEHPVGRAITWLRDLHRQRWWRDPSDLLLTIIEQRRAFELAFAVDRPRDLWRRLRFLVDQARLFAESEGGDLRDFLAWAELQRHESARVHEPVLPEADDLSARIMTIHGSKGLEFPITIVSGLSTRMAGGRSGPSVSWDDDGVAAVKLSAALRTDNFDTVAEFEDGMDAGERLRLLYVALTRARDHLVVTTHHKPLKDGPDGSFAGLITKTIDDARGLHRRLDDVLAADDRPSVASSSAEEPAPAHESFTGPNDRVARDDWIARRQASLDAAALPRTHSATSIAARATEDAESRAGDDDESGVVEDDRVLFRQGRAGTSIGRAVHAVLQDGDLKAGEGLEDLARAAAAAEAIPSEVDAVIAKVRSARSAPSVQAAVDAERSWRELHVSAPVGDTTIEGYVDLLYQDGDDLVVVDYKTDTVGGPADLDAKVDRYRLQGATYAVALEEVTGRRVKDCIFVFATSGEAIERRVTDLGAAKAEVLALLTQAPGETPASTS